MTTRIDAPEGFFLQQLFERFNSSGMRYAVMRNHEPLPYSAGGSDLDLLVARQDGERTKALLYDAIQQAGGVALGISETPGFFKVYAFGQNSEAGGSWWGQCIDINVGLFFKGQNQLSDHEPWPVHDFRDITVLADGFAGVLGVLKEVLNNSTFPKRYATAAQQGIVQDWESIKRLLAPMGEDSLERLRTLVLSDAPSDGRAAECRQLRNAFLRHAMTAHPSEYFMGRVAYKWSKMRRYFKPSGMVIAILGVDGAGKSTIINAIKPVLDAATHNATVVQHLRPGLLPPLARLKGKNAVSTGPVLDPHGSKPSGTLGSLFRLTYLMLDYIFGYWVKIRPKIAKQPTVVIFDRYAYDMAIDPRRFRIALPSKVIRWFTRLAPKPDLIISLHCAPELIAARKQELPLAEISRQVDVLREFSEKEHRAILVSTDGCVEEVRDQIFVILRKLCSERNALIYVNYCHLQEAVVSNSNIISNTYKSRVDLFLDRCKGKDVLHLGCSSGRYLEDRMRRGSLLHSQLRSVARILYGLDLDRESLAKMKRMDFGNLIEGNAENLETVSFGQQFDVVIAGDLLEHLTRPGALLDGVIRLLKPDGCFIISTNNAFGLHYQLRRWTGQYTEHFEHVCFYSPETLVHLFQRHGYHVPEMYGAFTEPPNGWKQKIKFAIGKPLFRLFPVLAGTLIVVAIPLPQSGTETVD